MHKISPFPLCVPPTPRSLFKVSLTGTQRIVLVAENISDLWISEMPPLLSQHLKIFAFGFGRLNVSFQVRLLKATYAARIFGKATRASCKFDMDIEKQEATY